MTPSKRDFWIGIGIGALLGALILWVMPARAGSGNQVQVMLCDRFTRAVDIARWEGAEWTQERTLQSWNDCKANDCAADVERFPWIDEAVRELVAGAYATDDRAAWRANAMAVCMAIALRPRA